MHKQSIHVDAREELVGVGSLHPTRGSISCDNNHLKLLSHLTAPPCYFAIETQNKR